MTENSTHEFVGEPVSPGVQVTVVLLGWLLVLNGVFGNSFIIVTLAYQKSLHSLHNIYIANLAAADLLVTGYAAPFWVLDLTLGYHPAASDANCRVNGFLLMLCFVVSIYTLVLIAFNRYLGVCHHDVLPKLFTRATVVSSCLALWLVAVVVFLLPFWHVANSAYTYSLKARICIFDASNLASSYSILAFVNVILPTFLVGVFSFSILRFWKISKAKVEHWSARSDQGPAPPRRQKVSSADLALVRSLVLVFVILILLYCPLVIMDVVDKSLWQVPGDLFAFGVFLLLLNHSINWILYGILNKNFKRAYKQQITQCFRGRTKSLQQNAGHTVTRPPPSTDA